MKFYPESYDVTLTVPAQDPAGNTVSPSSVTAKLYDEENIEIADLGAQSFVDGSTSLDVTVPRVNLTLDPSAQRAAFMVMATFNTTAGSFTRSVVFGIERDMVLKIMSNSFLTFVQAEMMIADYVNANGWASASEPDRKRALVEAFNRLRRIPMQFTPRDEDGKLQEDKRQIIPRDLWPEETRADFDAYPKHFRDALREAQLIEADNILKGDMIAQKRAEGILVEEIHESRVEISPNVATYDICEAAMEALAGYIHFDIRIGRV